FYYDSYVPSQAYANDTPQIVNPDIDPVLNGKGITGMPLRNRSTTLEEAFGAWGAFFSLFATINVTGGANSKFVNGKFINGTFMELNSVITSDAIVSFAGDPKYLPFADNKIRQGPVQVERTFTQQLANSLPRSFDLQELFQGTTFATPNGNGAMNL